MRATTLVFVLTLCTATAACALVVRPGASDAVPPRVDASGDRPAPVDAMPAVDVPPPPPDTNGPFPCADATCRPDQVCALRGGGGAGGPPLVPRCEDLPGLCMGSLRCDCLCPGAADGGGFACAIEGRRLNCLCLACP